MKELYIRTCDLKSRAIISQPNRIYTLCMRNFKVVKTTHKKRTTQHGAKGDDEPKHNQINIRRDTEPEGNKYSHRR
jgi:hypothetical protein